LVRAALSPEQSIPSIALGSSSVGLRCIPLDLQPLPAGPSGSFLRGLSFRPFPDSSTGSLMTFASSPELPSDSRCRRRSYPRFLHLPLMRFVQSVCPSSDKTCLRQLVSTVARRPAVLPLPSAHQRQLMNVFRPRGFAPPRRFTPQTGVQACCIPEPEGVRSLSGTIARSPPDNSKESLACVRYGPSLDSNPRTEPFPLRSSHPSKKSPCQQPESHLCDPLPPRR